MKKILLIALLALSFAANAELKTTYYDNGQKRYETNHKNGKIHHLWRFAIYLTKNIGE